MNRDDFIAANPLAIVLEQRGVQVKGQGVQRTARCPFHEDSTASLSVNVATGLWNCHAGCGGGSVIDLLAKFGGVSAADILRNGAPASNGHTPKPKPDGPEEVLKFETVATYDYENALGELAYQVVRQQAASKLKPGGYVKTFRQRQPDNRGGWIYNMDGAERVLYRLPEVQRSKIVWIVEGEKDADTLCQFGFTATCNVGGAGKWLDGYTESLARKHVAICGDNDEPGKKHAKEVFDSIAGRVKSVRVIALQKDYKDVSDFVASFKDKEQAKHALHALYDSATPFVKGVSLPIYSVAELEGIYQRHANRLESHSFSLGRWLPGLNAIRNLVAGELVLILGATGIGKTAALSNIALAAWPMPTLFFELELPSELMFERLLALRAKMSCRDVEKAYQSGETLGEEWFEKKLSHLHICTQSRLTPQDIETLIVRSELKIGERPRLVLLDYIGLVHGMGKSRYERVSQVAEDLKVIAKTTQTIIVVASQVNRDAAKESPEITLNSGKDSGSLENSSGLVMGMWRDKKDVMAMHLQVLKSTKGGAGLKITCDYNLNTLAITQRSQFDAADVPDIRHPHAND